MWRREMAESNSIPTDTGNEPQHVCAAGLAGKDYFTVREAAEYACVSYSHWRARVQREFPPGEFKGKLLYRRADVARYIEQNTHWPLSSAAASWSALAPSKLRSSRTVPAGR
jgi:hypothetical protein